MSSIPMSIAISFIARWQRSPKPGRDIQIELKCKRRQTYVTFRSQLNVIHVPPPPIPPPLQFVARALYIFIPLSAKVCWRWEIFERRWATIAIKRGCPFNFISHEHKTKANNKQTKKKRQQTRIGNLVFLETPKCHFAYFGGHSGQQFLNNLK